MTHTTTIFANLNHNHEIHKTIKCAIWCLVHMITWKIRLTFEMKLQGLLPSVCPTFLPPSSCSLFPWHVIVKDDPKMVGIQHFPNIVQFDHQWHALGADSAGQMWSSSSASHVLYKTRGQGSLGGIIENLLPLGQSHWAVDQISNDQMPSCLTAVWWPLWKGLQPVTCRQHSMS